MEVIVDVDPGADDAMALLLLLKNPAKYKITAVTTVAGNADIDSVTKNAVRTLAVANRLDIPVYKGASQGLINEASCEWFFGLDGFGEIKFDSPLPKGILRDEIAANILVNHVKTKPNEVTILALGPLTNLALAILLYPDFLNEVKEVIILGGNYKGAGNQKMFGEFNFTHDPEAAYLVLSKSPENKPVMLLPMDTVVNAGFSMDWRRNILGGIKSTAMEFLNKVEELSLKKRINWNPYDPAAACILIDPKIVAKSIMVTINVLRYPVIASGIMLTDDISKKKNVRLITELNKSILETLLLKYLS